MQIGSPIGVFIKRREPVEPPRVTFAEANVRPVEPIYFNDAPDPVRQSDFNDRPAKMPKVVFTNIPGIESVMTDEFGRNLWSPLNPGAFVYQAQKGGGQMPLDERLNIQDPQSVPYGSSFMIPSTPTTTIFPVGEVM